MKKLVVRVVLALVVILVVGLGGLYFYRNSLIRSQVEKQANASLGVPTSLGSANLGLFGGTLSLGDLKIGSPKGYQAPQMFTLGELGLGVNYGELRQDPIRVKSITIDKPKAVLEYVDGKFNFQALMDQMAPAEKKEDKPAQKMIIDELTVKDAAVEVRAPMLGSPITVNVPTVTLKNVGNGEGAQNGAAIKDVIGATMSALAASAANSPELRNMDVLKGALQAQAQQVMGKVQKELGTQLQAITGNVTDQLNKTLGNTGIDVGKAIPGATGAKDPAKAVQDGLGGLLGGDKKKDEKKK